MKHTKQESKLIIFENKKIRRVWNNEEWYFSVIDVVEVLTDSNRPRKYWSDLKSKLSEEEGSTQLSEKIGRLNFAQLSEKIVQLKLPASDDKEYATDCGNVETIFRIIQSIRALDWVCNPVHMFT